MGYLKEILLGKKKETKKLKESYKDCAHPGSNSAAIQSSKNKGRFLKNIKKGKVNIIAEIKKASPSKGVINSNLDIEKTALIYDRFKSFICGISVLTEPLYFGGEPENVKIVKEKTLLPVLRKDFIFNETLVYESAALGTDCILLISSLLGSGKLKKLYNLACSLGMDVLVEVHGEEDLKKALDIGASFIGINNRNLRNMSVNKRLIYDFLDNARSRELSDKIIVCESAVRDVEYIKDLFLNGINTFLIGEYFMASDNLEKTLSDIELELKEGNYI
ncbi:MAG: indole-3-glycerol-phosphate synthase [Actinomycetota bacterium]|nr:indole-3-glycerol-phosphate synthase [Actinomycetota bacterium]